MRRSTRILLRTLVWVAIAVAVVALAAWIALRASLPELDGERRIAGLGAEVRVERDVLGTPVVRGATRLDVTRAIGFVHAQERFFQMDLTRRAAAGELADLLGPSVLAVDMRLRLHRFRARARAALAAVAGPERELLAAYAEGVNAGLAALSVRPPEYLLLRAKPRAWAEEDSLLAVYGMWIDLQGTEARREQQEDRLARVLPGAVRAFLDGADPRWQSALDGSVLPPAPLPSAEDYDLRRLDRTWFDAAGPVAGNPLRLTFAPAEPAPAVGSNNWALAGERTASSHALVANDMHLGLRVPNTWYRARLVVLDDGLDVTGVMLPGVPAIVAGSNGRVAWGFTNSYGDYQDLVIVEPAPGDSRRYLTADGAREFEVHDETIRVAGGDDVTLEVTDTIWGPLIGEDAAGQPLALAWTAHRAEAINLDLVALERVRDLDEAVRVAAGAGIPAQNAVIGDADGRIGWVVAGRIPERAGFDPARPASWAAPGVGWAGWVDRERQPHIVDPLRGQAWTANTRVVGGELLDVIGDGGYAHPARAGQIRDGLAALDAATPADMLAIHLDDRASYMGQWQPLLLEVLQRSGEEVREAEALVRAWAGHAAAEDPAYRMVREFEQAVTHRAFEMLTVAARVRWPDFRFRVPSGFTDVAWRLVRERPAHLLDPRFADWDAWLGDVAAYALGRAREGCDRAAPCTWGQANTTRIRHPLSGAVPLLAPWLDMPATPMSGDWSMPRVQTPVFGASERFAVEPGREEHGYFHMPGGQSGHPLSPFYRAGHDAWVRGEPTPFLPGPAEHVLTLVP